MHARKRVGQGQHGAQSNDPGGEVEALHLCRHAGRKARAREPRPARRRPTHKRLDPQRIPGHIQSNPAHKSHARTAERNGEGQARPQQSRLRQQRIYPGSPWQRLFQDWHRSRRNGPERVCPGHRRSARGRRRRRLCSVRDEPLPHSLHGNERRGPKTP